MTKDKRGADAFHTPFFLEISRVGRSVTYFSVHKGPSQQYYEDLSSSVSLHSFAEPQETSEVTGQTWSQVKSNFNLAEFKRL